MSENFHWICTGRGTHRPKILDTMTRAVIDDDGVGVWDPATEPTWDEMAWTGEEKASHRMVATAFKEGRPIIRKHMSLRETTNGWVAVFRCQACRLSQPVIISELGLRNIWERARHAGNTRGDISA